MYTTRIENCDLDQIAESGQCFRWQKTGDHSYRIPAFSRVVEVVQEENRFTFSCGEEEFCDIWRGYFDLDTDYAELISAIEMEDEFLYRAAASGSGLRILRQELWEVILSFVISQNNNIPRIKKSIEMLCSRYGQAEHSGAEICSVPDYIHIRSAKREELADKSLGLGYRHEYIWEICGYLDSNPSFLRELQEKDYEDAMWLLMERKGIGRKVASCICLYGLHCLDACPVDTWIKRIIEEDYQGKMPGWMTGRHAGVYQQYVFYYKRKQRMRKGR